MRQREKGGSFLNAGSEIWDSQKIAVMLMMSLCRIPLPTHLPKVVGDQEEQEFSSLAGSTRAISTAP